MLPWHLFVSWILGLDSGFSLARAASQGPWARQWVPHWLGRVPAHLASVGTWARQWVPHWLGGLQGPVGFSIASVVGRLDSAMGLSIVLVLFHSLFVLL